MIRSPKITSWAQLPEIMDVQLVAVLFNRSVESIKKLAQSNTIPAFKLGKEWRIRKSSLEKWIDEQEAKKHET